MEEKNIKEFNQVEELNKLKEEIVKKSESSRKEKKKLAWDSAIVTAILVVLVAVSIMQSLQSQAILEKIKSGNLKSNSGSASPALPSSVDSLPDMVGGC
jgi:nicotinamide riboside transporter PnuC